MKALFTFVKSLLYNSPTSQTISVGKFPVHISTNSADAFPALISRKTKKRRQSQFVPNKSIGQFTSPGQTLSKSEVERLIFPATYLEITSNISDLDFKAGQNGWSDLKSSAIHISLFHSYTAAGRPLNLVSRTGVDQHGAGSPVKGKLTTRNFYKQNTISNQKILKN
ncbi:MAG: hypothetical protein Q7T76_14445 [Ferruginibacter sp.]|nr:hypothetical protein [Ferruginibacter sp.]